MIRALITAGGTREPIDDVRYIGNASTGRFGAALARALVAAGVDVTVLASRELVSHPEWLPPEARVVRYTAFADLAAALEAETARPPDLVFMAAAVADYSPVPTVGKLSSDQDELVIRLRRNPKLLAGLRARCGERCVLVGFKLLSGVSAEELVRVAAAQRRNHQLDLCVANDLADFVAGAHPVFLCSASGAVRVEGPRDVVAAAVAAAALALAR